MSSVLWAEGLQRNAWVIMAASRHHTVLCHNTVLYFKIKKTLNFGFKFLVLYKFGRTVVLFLKLVFLSSLFWLLEKAKKPFSAKINVLWKSSVWTQRSRRGAACRILKISKKSLLANLIIIGQVQLFSEKNIQALVYFLGKKWIAVLQYCYFL